MSIPRSANIPPSAPKSFCISTTMTALCAGSMVNASGFAAMVTCLPGDRIALSRGFTGDWTLRVAPLSPTMQACVKSFVARFLRDTFGLTRSSQDGRPTPLTQLSERTRAQVLERLHLLAPHLEDGAPLPRLAREHGAALRTAQRWVDGYRGHELAGLVRSPRDDRGQHHRDSELRFLIEGLALRVPRPAPPRWRVRWRVSRKSGGRQPPCPGTAYVIVRRLDPALVTLAQEGPKAYRERFGLIYRREVARTYQIWRADPLGSDARAATRLVWRHLNRAPGHAHAVGVDRIRWW